MQQESETSSFFQKLKSVLVLIVLGLPTPQLIHSKDSRLIMIGFHWPEIEWMVEH